VVRLVSGIRWGALYTAVLTRYAAAMFEAHADPWLSLFDAALSFRDLRPWEWMDDGLVFGVVDPAAREIAWCVVLGMNGQVFGLAAYRGSAGLDILRAVHSGKLGPGDDEIRFGFPCLLTTFEDRDGLDARDLGRIKALGLTFRGRHAWPQFRSHRRGLCPWLLDDTEAGVLAEGLRQAVDVCERVRAEPDLLRPRPTGELLTRVMAGDGRWIDEWLKPPEQVSAVYPEPQIDAREVSVVKASAAGNDGTWEADLFYAPTPVQEERNARPFYPVAMTWMDSETGICLAVDLLPESGEPELHGNELVGKLLALTKDHSCIPRSIRVLRPALAAALTKAAGLLGCSVVVVKRLPALEGLKQQLFEHFA
jgi:hypothetical protein